MEWVVREVLKNEDGRYVGGQGKNTQENSESSAFRRLEVSIHDLDLYSKDWKTRQGECNIGNKPKPELPLRSFGLTRICSLACHYSRYVGHHRLGL